MTRWHIRSTLMALAVLAMAACGGQAPPSDEGASEQAPAETAPATAASEAEPADEASAPEEAAAAAEEAAPPSPTVSQWVAVIGADGHHRGEVTDELAEIVKAARGRNFTKVDLGGKTTLTWRVGERELGVVDFADLEAAQKGLGERKWAGAIFVSDPAQSKGNQDDFLGAARAAGIDKLVLFQVVSDLLEDMEVYDLEAQVWPDELAAKGFATAAMPTLQAHVAKAAAGDQVERKAFEGLLSAVEGYLTAAG